MEYQNKFVADLQDSVTHVCFSQDGKLLATGDYGGYIQVWELDSCNKIWEFEVGELGVSDIFILSF